MLSSDDAVVGALAPATASSSADDLVEVVQQLWPEGRVWEPAAGADDVRSMAYAFVPNRRAARFLVPLTDRASAGHTLRKYSAALSPGEIAQRTAMAFAFNLGGSSVLRDRVAVLGEHRALRSFLSDRFGTPVSFSISIGTARVNRKPVLQVFDPRGRTLAYVKVGSTDEVVRDVEAEARALRLVEDVLPPEIVAPRVIGAERWEGSFVLMLSPLPISMWQPARGRRSPPVGHMQLLNEAFAEPDQLLPQVAAWQRLRLTCAQLGPGPEQQEYVGLLDELELRSEARPMRVGAWHGDWTSWNMARSRRKVLLWDWERFERGVPAGLDHCHFLVNAATREKGFNVGVILAALAGLRPAGQHPTASDLAVGVYLARLALRYSSAAQGPAGYLISHRADVLRNAFSQWLSLKSRS